MVLFDTNMILRYLLNDNKEMAEQAEKYIEHEDVLVTIEVIAEVIYVLKGVYSLERKKISDTVKDFLDLVSCQEKEIVNLAVDIFGEKNLDFVDCVLYAYHKLKNMQVITFDKKLIKLMEDN